MANHFRELADMLKDRSDDNPTIRNTLIVRQAMGSIYDRIHEDGWDQRDDVVLLIDTLRDILPSFTDVQLAKVAKRLGPTI